MVRIRGEEMTGRVEPVIAGSGSRIRYFASNVTLAFTLPVLYLLTAGLLIAALASQADTGVEFGDTVLQAAVTVPATWTVVAVSVAVIGARPRFAMAAWLGVVATFALTILGPTFRLPDDVLGISPFWHAPHVTAENSDWFGLGGVTVVTTILLAVGFLAFRRRDLAS